MTLSFIYLLEEIYFFRLDTFFFGVVEYCDVDDVDTHVEHTDDVDDVDAHEEHNLDDVDAHEEHDLDDDGDEFVSVSEEFNGIVCVLLPPLIEFIDSVFECSFWLNILLYIPINFLFISVNSSFIVFSICWGVDVVNSDELSI
jgi:hypothetical protein